MYKHTELKGFQGACCHCHSRQRWRLFMQKFSFTRHVVSTNFFQRLWILRKHKYQQHLKGLQILIYVSVNWANRIYWTCGTDETVYKHR